MEFQFDLVCHRKSPLSVLVQKNETEFGRFFSLDGEDDVKENDEEEVKGEEFASGGHTGEDSCPMRHAIIMTGQEMTCLGPSNWTICSPLSLFYSGNFQYVALSY